MKRDAPPILIVEDSPTDLELMLHAMAAAGVANEIMVARDGQEALDMLASGEIDRAQPVILLDVKMSRVSGFDVLRALRERPALRHLPVVMLTSSRQDPDIARAYELGATSYIVKPVDFERFSATIKMIGHYWLVINEPPG